MQIKGRNYLIPVGSDIRRDDEVAYQSIDAQAVLDKMPRAGNGTNIMILDACRNNPFARSFRSSQQGLAQMEAPVGTLVAFATAPGSIASDGQGDNGLYTSHLLAALSQPGLKVEDVFKRVRAAVRRQSDGRQMPWESTSLEGDFHFHAPVATAAVAPAVDPLAALDDALWETVKDCNQAAELQAYLQRFPQGRHGVEAQARVATLAVPEPQAIPEPTTAAPATPVQDAASAIPGAAQTNARPHTVSMASAPNPAPQSSPTRPDDGVVAVSMPSPTEREERLRASVEKLEQIARWGDLYDAQRPANAQRNQYGFTEGNRFRYRVIDLMRRGEQSEFGWRIDRVTEDGDLIVNGGAVRLNGVGQVLAFTDSATGTKTEWNPPLPILQAGLAVGHQHDLEGGWETRDHSGQLQRIKFSGKLRVTAKETITTAAGTFETIRIDVTTVSALIQDPTLAFPFQIWGVQRIWHAWRLGVVVAEELEEKTVPHDSMPQRFRKELIALDMAQSPQFAGTSR